MGGSCEAQGRGGLEPHKPGLEGPATHELGERNAGQRGTQASGRECFV